MRKSKKEISQNARREAAKNYSELLIRLCEHLSSEPFTDQEKNLIEIVFFAGWDAHANFIEQ